jgi:purine nucleosidase
VRLHLDTDLGGDPDDACALTMLLGWPGAELTGITTTIDPGGRRAGCVVALLELLGRTAVPVTAGAEMSLTTRELAEPNERLFPPGVTPRPASAGAALDVLERAIADRVRIAAIGPLTNLAALELLRPGALAAADLVVMGGWVDPPGPGLPAWGPERDWNLQWDTRAAEVVVGAAGRLTLVTLPATLSAPLTGRDLPRLRALGPLGELLARQSEARRDEASYAELGRAHPGLPDDLVNFHFDPVACAVAAGWDGVRIRRERLSAAVADGVLYWRPDRSGRPVELVTAVDGAEFTATWFAAVERALRSDDFGP